MNRASLEAVPKVVIILKASWQFRHVEISFVKLIQYFIFVRKRSFRVPCKKKMEKLRLNQKISLLVKNDMQDSWGGEPI